MKTISIEELIKRLEVEKPNNRTRRSGYALVHVLEHRRYLEEHIPNSINIPKGQEKEFEKRFEKSKEIIVYSDSDMCKLASLVAEELAGRGFKNVFEYEGGMSGWKLGGYELERGSVSALEMKIA